MTGIELVHLTPGDEARSYFTPGAGPLWIGRDRDCDVVLPSELISRRHARVSIAGDRLRVEDRSANGTRVAGERIHREARDVAPVAEIELGPYRMRARIVAVDDRECAVPAELRRRIQRGLLEHIELARLPKGGAEQLPALRPKVVAALARVCEALAAELPRGVDRARLIEELADEALGLGPLERLLAAPDVSEIMVVDANTIYAERNGVIERTALRFSDEEAVRSAIERIVAPLGRRIDESQPLVDARLPDGSRVNAIIPPLARRGPCITIRKFTRAALSLDDLVARGSLSPAMAELLSAAVRARKNLIVSGGTGSGKTTLLNVLSAAIPESERIVTIEDAAELRLAQPHVVSLESRPANLEGKGAYTIRDLVRNALRMRPDRIIVGECRGGEAIDMLQAMNTGHDGSMTTTHANSPREAIARLEVLCLMAGLSLPLRAVRQQIATSLHLIVQQARFADGSRRVTSISEVLGVDEQGEVELRELFRFARTGAGAAGAAYGEFVATGHVPSFAAELARADAGGGPR